MADCSNKQQINKNKNIIKKSILWDFVLTVVAGLFR